MDLKKKLRASIREQRQQLSISAQQEASKKLMQQLLPYLSNANSIALYLANDGEISPEHLLHSLWRQNKTVLLPVMHPLKKGYLNFQQYQQDSQMVANNFGILEPKINAMTTYPLEQIDVIVMPLVAFDKQGNRLGMGGGFYDRTLNRLHELANPPILIGVGHTFQLIERLPTEPWDIRIDLLITPNEQIKVENH